MWLSSIKTLGNLLINSRQNIVNYVTFTGHNNYNGFSEYYKANQHSHFTSGVNKILVLKTLSSTPRLKIKIHNIEEKDQFNHQILETLVNLGERRGIPVTFSFESDQFFDKVLTPTLVVDDELKDTNLDINLIINKIELLQEFTIGVAYNLQSKVKIYIFIFLEIQ